ncbi:MAG: hypothetical protein U0V48_11630 [Anaerolineales bacterium]
MRILVLNHEFPLQSAAAAARGGRAFAKPSPSAGTRSKRTSHFNDLSREGTMGADSDVIRVDSLPSLDQPSVISRWLARFSADGAGLRLSVFRPDGSFTSLPAGALAWMLSRLTRVPYVLTAHLGDVPGGVPEKRATGSAGYFLQRAGSGVTQVQEVAVSEYTRSLALKHYNEEVSSSPTEDVEENQSRSGVNNLQ